MKNKVIIIIPNYNGQKYFSDLLPLLAVEKYNDFDLEIVIVDNNSKDGSREYLENNYSQFTLIKNEENTGYVGANNIGYQYALEKKAKYIYLLNQDTIIKKGFLQPLYDFAEENNFGSLQSKIRLYPAEDKINSLGNIIHFLGFGYTDQYYKVDNNDQEIKKINYSSGAGVFIAMKALKDLGYLFDETMFMYLEDLDLGWSLNLLGYDNYIIPESIIYHKYEFKKGIKQIYWFERNRLWIILKNYKLKTLLLILPAYLLMEIGQLFYAFQNKYLFRKLKSYAFLFSFQQLKLLKKKRKYIQKKRRISDREMFNFFSGQILFQPLSSKALQIANFILNIYYRLIKLIIIW